MAEDKSLKEYLIKLQRYCAYQERCYQEVREKLNLIGAPFQFHQEIISRLEEENYLNEERFAEMFVRGKFRIKHWGKIKIKQALLAKNINNELIYKALNEINELEYEQTLEKTIRKRNANLKDFSERDKLFKYLLSRGFESHLILSKLNNNQA
ncbi:MAG: RecX family transcriptional regulator [Bacteroidetes bacterium]|nr:RecX family transcriptional regulator [Bacteroidota bacterium]